MTQSRAEIVAWVGSQVLPHEGDVRAWLRRRLPSQASVDDVIQEAYCRIAALGSVSHIGSGRAYLFRVASNILVEQLRRARIVQIDSMAEIESLHVVDDEPSPERIVSGRRELALVQSLIEALPERCRKVFELRRIHGLPQREVARRLGVTENVVEQQSVRGLRLILKRLAEETEPDVPLSKATERQHRERRLGRR